MTGDAGCSKTSAGITYPFTRGLASMLYLRNLWPSLFHPLILRGTLFCAAPRLPGYPPKNERSSDDSDLKGVAQYLNPLRGDGQPENRDASVRLGLDEVCGYDWPLAKDFH